MQIYWETMFLASLLHKHRSKCLFSSLEIMSAMPVRLFFLIDNIKLVSGLSAHKAAAKKDALKAKKVCYSSWVNTYIAKAG